MAQAAGASAHQLRSSHTSGKPPLQPCTTLLSLANHQEAEAYAKEKGWTVAPDGDAFRRVVASPLPHDIVEARAVQVLLQVRHWC